MTARRTAARIAATTIAAPVALTALATGTAAAHGSMEDPASRVYTCFQEGPEAPRSAACKAAIQASGTQAFYDWTEVNIPDAAGRHQEIIPDGKLCSAGRDKYKGLDLPRTDWPAAEMSAGQHTFRYKATAPHKGSFELYMTKAGYDPSQPLKWSDLESEPFAEATDPALENGAYVIDGTVPERSGRHLVYAVWQRSDSPEAFYSCSDVVFGGGGGQSSGDSALSGSGEEPGGDAPAAGDDAQSEPQGGQEEQGTGAHGAHGDHADRGDADRAGQGGEVAEAEGLNDPAPAGGDAQLAETGGESSTAPIAIGGAAALALGAAALLNTVRRRATGRHRA